MPCSKMHDPSTKIFLLGICRMPKDRERQKREWIANVNRPA
jgi:hypothetical protein